MFSVFRAIALTIFLAGFSSHAWTQEQAGSEIAEKCQAVCQDKDAAWRSVAWETDLIAAQHLAVDRQKPLFVWAMDGHPLGCT